jgi:hypothetical protein
MKRPGRAVVVVDVKRARSSAVLEMNHVDPLGEPGLERA